jgi:hypothetical protein
MYRVSSRPAWQWTTARPGDRDCPDVDRRIAQQDGDRSQVTQVEIGIDDDRDPFGGRLAGLDRPGTRLADGEHAPRTTPSRHATMATDPRAPGRTCLDMAQS